MKFEELFEKYQALRIENDNLEEEIRRLKAKLSPEETPPDIQEYQAVFDFGSFDIPEVGMFESEAPDGLLASGNLISSSINNFLDPIEKIKLYMSFFKGRDDVYARRWENSQKRTSGYSPVCLNEWKPGLCRKPQERCTNCSNKRYAVLDELVIDAHLRGNNNLVAGIYPICSDETCHFLAIDFDGEEWSKDVAVIREVCSEFHIPIAIERSRSGRGAYAFIALVSLTTYSVNKVTERGP